MPKGVLKKSTAKITAFISAVIIFKAAISDHLCYVFHMS
jgi:hypothetical protein